MFLIEIEDGCKKQCNPSVPTILGSMSTLHENVTFLKVLGSMLTFHVNVMFSKVLGSMSTLHVIT